MRLSVDEIEAAGGYSVLYADPAWKYRAGGRGAARDHYRESPLSEIKSLPVARIAARDAVLFMWTTCPFLVESHQAHDVMEAWGFTPKTVAFFWMKTTRRAPRADDRRPELYHVGMGSWTRANVEVCLLGTRGKPRRGASTESKSVRQLLVQDELEIDELPDCVKAPLGRHSEKPAEVRRRIEVLMGPNQTRLEMFARERFAGWDAHGEQVPGGADVVF